MVVPMKWLPYLLVIGGIGMLSSGEDTGIGILAAALGGIWLYFKHSGK